MKKWISTVAVSMATAMLIGCGGGASDTVVSVDSVGNITGIGALGITDKFSGLVVSEDEVKIEKSADLSVKELKVKEGDVVKEGDILFVYDTDSLELTLEKQQLELEQLKATIENKQKEIKQLQKDAKGAKGSTKLEYTIQIQTAEADIKEAEYNIKLKEKEVEATKESLQDVNVTSPITGTVKSIASENQSANAGYDDGGYDMSGENEGESANAYIVLTKSDSFEVKGTINEMNAGALQEGMPLLIRSRVDAAKTWTGTLERIDWEKADTSNTSMMYYGGGSDEMTTSSKYPFYVTLDSQEGLLLGQHVYIETNVDGGEETGEGFSLPSYYIVDLDSSSPYVWAEGTNGKLEKRKVQLGEYDEEMDQYPVLSGLELTDYIAFPSEECSQGVKAERYDQNSGEGIYSDLPDDGVDDAGVYDGEMTDEGMYEEEMPEDGAYEEEFDLTEDAEAIYPEDQMPEDGAYEEEFDLTEDAEAIYPEDISEEMED